MATEIRGEYESRGGIPRGHCDQEPFAADARAHVRFWRGRMRSSERLTMAKRAEPRRGGAVPGSSQGDAKGCGPETIRVAHRTQPNIIETNLETK